MGEVKWLLKKWGGLFILLFLVLAAGSFITNWQEEADEKDRREVWELDVKISENSTASSDTGVAGIGEEPKESPLLQYFSEQSECLLREDEKKELEGKVLAAATQVKEVFIQVISASIICTGSC